MPLLYCQCGKTANWQSRIVIYQGKEVTAWIALNPGYCNKCREQEAAKPPDIGFHVSHGYLQKQYPEGFTAKLHFYPYKPTYAATA